MNSEHCTGITKSGKCCQRLPEKGSKYCYQHKKSENTNQTLYERLGGIFAIAAVVNRFSDQILKNPKVGVNSPNPCLRDWSIKQSPARLPGLKWMRTLWVCSITGGPYKYIGTRPDNGNQYGLANAHKNLHISSDEFDAVADELKDAMDFYKVPSPEQTEVLSAFMAHKGEVTKGSSFTGQTNMYKTGKCPFSGTQY